MGRLLYDLGKLAEKTRIANERGSSKVGKSSFSWAWGLDGTAEERERFIYWFRLCFSLADSHLLEASQWISPSKIWPLLIDKSQF